MAGVRREFSIQHSFQQLTISLFYRCDADPNDLDNPNASLRTREQTATLLETEDPETLWYNHGIVPDLQVCRHSVNISV